MRKDIYEQNHECYRAVSLYAGRHVACRDLAEPLLKEAERMSEQTDSGSRSLQVVPKDGKLNPRLSVESRPSNIDGLGFWLVLQYKDWSAERMLPRDFMALDEMTRNFTVIPLAEELRQELAPILEAEDNE